MKVITKNMIVEMNNMYKEGKSIKAIANNMYISPYTVKKYIDIKEENQNNDKIVFDKPLPEFDSAPFRDSDWGKMCMLDKDEIEEIRKLWEEIEF